MCWQCNQGEYLVAWDITDNLSLMMGKEEWGLVTCNNPDFTWPRETISFMEDPLFGIDGEDLDNNDPIWILSSNYINECCRLAKYLKAGPNEGHTLVEECKKAGYDKDKHGTLEFWLLHVMSQKVLYEQPRNANAIDPSVLKGIEQAEAGNLFSIDLDQYE